MDRMKIEKVEQLAARLKEYVIYIKKLKQAINHILYCKNAWSC